MSAGLLGLLVTLEVCYACCAQAGSQTATTLKTPPAVGTIKEISGNTLTLATDSGTELKVMLPSDVKLLRVPPGSKDLKESAPIQLSELKEGDRILVRGKQGDDAKTFVAAMVVAMRKEDLAAKQAHEREEWQRHGIGGLVKSVDEANGVVAIGTLSTVGSKEVAVRVSKSTIVRRYAPDSVKFDDAKISSLGEVRAGDQLRARGMRSADGEAFTADEIVTGSFRNIAGTIVAVDARTGTMSVADLMTKKPVELKITPDSQVRKLPQPMAQRIAMRLKGGSPDANQTGSAGTSAGPPNAGSPSGGIGQGAGGAPNGGGGRGGVNDLQQMLSRLPARPLSEFQKGDAVMIVATSGESHSQPTVITLLGGVEPILQASPAGQPASILTPWSLSSGGGDAGTP